MTTTYQQRTKHAFLLVLLVPVALGLLSLGVTSRHRVTVVAINHTQGVLQNIDDTLLSISGAESSSRGYLLTMDPAFLAAYERAHTRISTQLRDLRTLTNDNPAQVANLTRLSALVTDRLFTMEGLLNLRKSHGLPPLDASLAIEHGRQVMRDIYATARAMQKEENRLLSERVLAEKTSRQQVAVCFAIGIILNVLLVYWAYKLTREYARQRDRSEYEIRQLNAELEDRVRERTAELEAANEKLRRSNEDLTTFAYVASHDLQEPLRTMSSYAGLLARRYEGKLDEQAEKYIRFLIDGAKRMQAMVQDLLAYSKAGTQAVNIGNVSINAILQDVKDNLRLAIAERKAQITIGSLPTIEADAAKLSVVFQNLIANALKFSKPDVPPQISIEASRKGSDWFFSVQDNGIGFEPQYADRIFIIFQRLHHVGAYPGTGIGLALCKRIVEGHGGHISVTSALGLGSVFTFSLPAEHGHTTHRSITYDSQALATEEVLSVGKSRRRAVGRR